MLFLVRLLPYSIKIVTNVYFALADGDDTEVQEDDNEEITPTSAVNLSFSPTDGQVMPTDEFLVEWEYAGDLEGMITVEVYEYAGEEYEHASTTSADWSDSSISLPSDFLPPVSPGSTSAVTVWAYSYAERSLFLDWGAEVSLWARGPTPTSTSVKTTTSTTTENSQTTRTSIETTDTTSTTTEHSDPARTSIEKTDTTPISEDNDNGSANEGLTTGGKAGIGVGVSAGAILIAAGAFLLFRRRKRQEPKTIREIPAARAVNLPGPGPAPEMGPQPPWKLANTSSSGNSYELSG